MDAVREALAAQLDKIVLYFFNVSKSVSRSTQSESTREETRRYRYSLLLCPCTVF